MRGLAGGSTGHVWWAGPHASKPTLQPSCPFTCSHNLLSCARPELVNNLLRTFLAGKMHPATGNGKGKGDGDKASQDGGKPHGIPVHAAPAGSGATTPVVQK